MRRLVALGIATVFGALAVAGTALADTSSSSHGYGGAAGAIQHSVQKGGTLPFTGFDLSMIVVFAILLISAGFAVRRLGRKRVTR